MTMRALFPLLGTLIAFLIIGAIAVAQWPPAPNSHTTQFQRRLQ
jgi:hypothetical protein